MLQFCEQHSQERFVGLDPRYQHILQRWFGDVATAASEGIAEMFHSADEVLMEFAERAESVNIQNHFFEAQRELWLRKEEFSLDFHDRVSRSLRRFPDDDPQLNPAGGHSDLEILEPDAYERSIALITMAEQLAVKAQPELYQLATRLSLIGGGKPVKPIQVPGAPQQICKILSLCTQSLRIETAPLLVLYTLFDKHVLQRLPELYHKLNEQLIEAGVLPNLKYEIRRNPKAAAAPTPATADKAPATDKPASSAAEQADESMRRIQQLMSVRRKLSPPRPPLRPGQRIATNDEIAETATVMAHREDLALPPELLFDRGEEQVVIDRAMLQRIRQLLLRQRDGIKHTIGEARLTDTNEDVIDLIGMLFERMLDDPNLPESAKALFSHLHTPFLKLALQSRSLLTDSSHPARRFFNTATSAAERWVVEGDMEAGIYPKLKELVGQIVKFRKSQPEDFEDHLEVLRKAVHRLESRADIVEQRSRESEMGMARLNHARSIAVEQVGRLFAGSVISGAARTFVDHAYVDYLTLILLRSQSGPDSDIFERGLAIGRLLREVLQAVARKRPESAKLAELQQRLQEEVGAMLPHQIAQVEALLGSLEESTTTWQTFQPPQPQPPVKSARKGSAELEQNCIRLRQLEPGTWLDLQVDPEHFQRIKISWYNNTSDRLLLVDQIGKKVGLHDVVELAAKLKDGQLRIIEKQPSFFERALNAIRKTLESRTPVSQS